MKLFGWLFRYLRQSPSLPRVVLYTRDGCHLCEDAKDILSEHGLVPKEINIDHDPCLQSQFDECVPVVEIDGKIRFRGRIDRRLLRRLLS